MRDLHLLGLGGLGAEAVDERFEVLDLFALVAVGGFQLRAPLVFLAEILGVVALIDIQALVPDLHGTVDGHVEKVAVVGDKDVAEGISAEIVLEPVAGFEIEVVGRLVEQQQVRLGQQQLGQRDAHLPAAAELVRLARPVFLAESEAGEHAAHLCVERVAVERVKALLEHRVAFRRGLVLLARVVEYGQLPGEMLDFLFHLAQFVEDGEALFKDGATGERKAFLRQIADAHAACLLQAGRSRAIRSRPAPSSEWICRCRWRPPARFFPCCG